VKLIKIGFDVDLFYVEGGRELSATTTINILLLSGEKGGGEGVDAHSKLMKGIRTKLLAYKCLHVYSTLRQQSYKHSLGARSNVRVKQGWTLVW